MSVFRFLRCCGGLALAAVLAGCAGAMPAPAAPKLVVVLVVDGLPQRQVLAYRDQLAPDGFARFLDRGAWFAQANWRHAYTVTAVGHAALLTGASPDRTGIIGNDWRDRDTGARVYNTADRAARYIGQRTDPLDGTSPRNLKVETVGDVLRRVDPRSKVIAISGKDRGAILPAGRTGTAYMYMDDSGDFASSTYYMQDHPGWVKQFQAARPADRFFRSEWKPLLAEAAYARSLPDRQPWFGRAGGALPMAMGSPRDSVPGPAYYRALLASPFVDLLSLEFARAAIAGEQLGRDDAPDLLAISLSGHDFVNHNWSAESRLSHDHFLQLDRMLQDFFRDLDASVGRDNYLALLTADHGFTPAPDVLRAQGLETGRIDFQQTLANLNAGLSERFGPGRWVVGSSASSLLLDHRLVADRHVDIDAVADEARRLLLAQPGFAAAYTARELRSGSRAGAPFFEALRRAWHPDVSGEVQYTVRANWVFGATNATHGSPYRDDTHVPILLWGPRWVKPGRIDTPVEPLDIAPTLARLLGVPAPAASEGRLLPLGAP
jgi:predicted AlkP superfamily pyrophosphatase or phosphodiesterase